MKTRSKGEPKRVKVGRIKYVCDHSGKPLVGLSWDRGNGQFYFTEWKSERDVVAGRKTRKDYSFGSNYDEAVFKFKQWRQETGKFTLSVPAPMDTGQRLTFTRTPEQLQGMKEIMEAEGIDDYPADSTYSFPALDVETDSPQHIIEGKITTDKQYALHLLRQLLSKEDIRIRRYGSEIRRPYASNSNPCPQRHLGLLLLIDPKRSVPTREETSSPLGRGLYPITGGS